MPENLHEKLADLNARLTSLVDEDGQVSDMDGYQSVDTEIRRVEKAMADAEAPPAEPAQGVSTDVQTEPKVLTGEITTATPRDVARVVNSKSRKKSAIPAHVEREITNADPEWGYFVAMPYMGVGVAERMFANNGRAMRVYGYLAMLADNDTSVCWPSVNKIAQAVHVGRNSVAGIIQELVDLGFVETRKRYDDSIVYFLPHHRAVHDAGRKLLARQ